jgi:hypothetical protein
MITNRKVRYNMKKFLLLSILFIILSIVISSISPQIKAQERTIDSSEKTYESMDDGIRIKYPAAWSFNSETFHPNLIVTFHPPPIDASKILAQIINDLRDQDQATLEKKLQSILGSSASISLWVFPSSNQPLSNYVKEKMEEIQETAPKFNKLTNIQFVYIGAGESIPAYQLSYMFDLGGENKGVKTIWTIHNGKAYQFIYLADLEIFTSHLSSIEVMIHSLKFI